MKILIVGANGQLGHELITVSNRHDVLAVDVDKLDITDLQAVKEVVKVFKPDAVINAAAYTAVDKAESERDLAFAVNRDGPAHLAESCAEAAIPLIHVSTDYVFDGNKNSAYIEHDPTAPLGVYGESKLAGEEAVRKICVQHIIFRTSWVISSHGNNFVKTMLRLGSEREELDIVADQHGCPTSAGELARGIMHVLESGKSEWGTYHFCQPEPTTWHGFAEAIFTEARRQGVALNIQTVNPIATSDYPTPAARPGNSVMNCSHFEDTFGFKIRPWYLSLIHI